MLNANEAIKYIENNISQLDSENENDLYLLFTVIRQTLEWIGDEVDESLPDAIYNDENSCIVFWMNNTSEVDFRIIEFKFGDSFGNVYPVKKRNWRNGEEKTILLSFPEEKLDYIDELEFSVLVESIAFEVADSELQNVWEELVNENDNNNSYIDINSDNNNSDFETDQKYKDFNTLIEVRSRIDEDDLKEKVFELEEVVKCIIDQIDSREENRDVCEKFVSHYFHITVSVLQKLVALRVKDEDSEEYQAVNNDIHELLDTSIMASKNVLGNHVKSNVIEAETEMSALKAQMTLDGLL